MNKPLQDPMRDARWLTRAGRMNDAVEAIQRALGAHALQPAAVRAFDKPTRAPLDDFTTGSHTQGGRTLRYKLYAPSGHAGRPLPLVVMLHGCTQNPDDFAAGTAMNELACEQGFIVLYPAQAQEANPQRCWNWFKRNHQRRGSGEPAVIGGMTQAVMKTQAVDPRRVYIAGLSAGGAMAAIVAAAYPEIFAAAGVHSGLPGGAASDVAGALAVMGSGEPGDAMGATGAPAGRFGMAPPARADTTTDPRNAVPTIVFHGDHDRTVHPRNGERVIAAALAGDMATTRVEHGRSAGGKAFTRSIHADAEGRTLAGAWRRARLVGRQRERLLHRCLGARRHARNAALFRGLYSVSKRRPLTALVTATISRRPNGSEVPSWRAN